jgi:hypothetical protein
MKNDFQRFDGPYSGTLSEKYRKNLNHYTVLFIRNTEPASVPYI